MNRVAAISFLDDHSISMDVENVSHIGLGPAMQLEDGTWTSAMLIRTGNGTVAINLVADTPEGLRVDEASLSG